MRTICPGHQFPRHTPRRPLQGLPCNCRIELIQILKKKEKTTQEKHILTLVLIVKCYCSIPTQQPLRTGPTPPRPSPELNFKRALM